MRPSRTTGRFATPSWGWVTMGLFAADRLGLHGVWGQDCGIPPLAFDIKNTTFADGIAMNRGVELQLGGQLLGLRLSLSQNNTRVRNARDCPADDPAGFSACQGASGGVFDMADNTFATVPESRWNVSVLDAHPQDATIAFGYGRAEFPNTSAVVPRLPVEVWSNVNAANKSELPLGPGSSFLRSLVVNSWASTANFGLYYGSRSQNQAQDGELVVGGINTARFDYTTLTEFPLSGYGAKSRCPFQVMLSDVVLTNSEGEHSLFKDPDAQVPACIDTVQNAFTFTKTMFDEWARLTQHVAYDGSNYTAQLYPAAREPLLGSLTIRLTNGYTSVIPHYELVSMERGTDAQGKYAVLNSSRVMAAVQTGAGDLGVDVPLLGGVFLSQNYLRADYDKDRFWLARAETAPTLKPAIGTICHPVATEPAESTRSSGDDSSDLGLKIGLPVAFTVAALGVFAWWLFKRHRQPLVSQRDLGPAQSHFRSIPFSAAGSVGPGLATERKRSELETVEPLTQLDDAGACVRKEAFIRRSGVAELDSPRP